MEASGPTKLSRATRLPAGHHLDRARPDARRSLCLAPPAVSGANVGARQSRQSPAVVAIARRAMEADHLRAVVLRVTVDDKPVVTRALGTSMTGVPATTAMPPARMRSESDHGSRP